MTNLKAKDIIISVIISVLTLLSVAFYFLPIITIRHDTNINFSKSTPEFQISAFDTTRSLFLDRTRDLNNDKGWTEDNSRVEYLITIRDKYPAINILIAITSPLLITSLIMATIFTLLAVFKNEKFKMYAFITTICSMVLALVFMVCCWVLANKFIGGNNLAVFNANIKGSVSYAAFVLLIISFITAIVVCVHNYFIGDDEDNLIPDGENGELGGNKVLVNNMNDGQSEKLSNNPKKSHCPYCGAKLNSDDNQKNICPNCKAIID